MVLLTMTYILSFEAIIARPSWSKSFQAFHIYIALASCAVFSNLSNLHHYIYAEALNMEFEEVCIFVLKVVKIHDKPGEI